jgi:predicted aldo/keto reductase-like oxidoreductase
MAPAAAGLIFPAMGERSSEEEAARLGRRDFLAVGTAAVATTAAFGAGPARAGEPPKKPQPGAPRAEDVKLPPGGKMPMRKLGRTGVEVSLVGLGGFHLGLGDEANAVRIVRTAIDHGVTFMDNCWDYNEGKSHRYMGRALRDGYRKRAFLMTKIDGRTKQAAAQQIEQSLRDLDTETIDLMQIHEVIRPGDADRSFGPGGAMEALLAARKAGKIRFIGFTGHKSPQIHLRMLETAAEHHFTFDAVQMPLNLMDAHFDSFERRVLPVLVQQQIGVLGMKPLGSGLFLRSKPFVDGAVTATDALQYAMSLPTSVVITGCDTPGVLMQALDAAYRFVPLDEARRKALLARTSPAAGKGEWERYKVSQDFDGTARNPHWLETAKL